LSLAIGRLPEETRRATLQEWEQLDEVGWHIGELEVRIRERIGCVGRLLSLPKIGEDLRAPTVSKRNCRVTKKSLRRALLRFPADADLSG
jgi:hypothetical protein